MSNYVPLSIRITEATNKLKDAGYTVFNTNDETFAILKERKKIVCKGYNNFFKQVLKLTK